MSTLAFTATSGNNVVIAGSGSTPTIEILAVVFQAGAASTVTLKAGSTNLTGPMSFSNGGSYNLGLTDIGPWFTVTGGDDFVINVSLLGQCAGFVIYNQY